MYGRRSVHAKTDGVPTAKTFEVTHNNFADNNKNNSDDTIKQKINSDVWGDIALHYQNDIIEDESYVEYAENSTQKRSVHNKKELKENLMKQYMTATDTINTKLDTIHEMLGSTLKVQKRRLDLEEKICELNKKKLEMYEKNQHPKLRLQEKMLTTKVEENRIRVLEVKTRKL